MSGSDMTNTVAEMLLGARKDTVADLPLVSIPAYCWTVRSFSGAKPSQAWVFASPELNPSKQRIHLKCNAWLDLQQTQEIAAALLVMAGNLDRRFAEPRVLQQQASARSWAISYPHKIKVDLKTGSSYPILLKGDYALAAKTAWEVGSHLLQIVSQCGEHGLCR